MFKVRRLKQSDAFLAHQRLLAGDSKSLLAILQLCILGSSALILLTQLFLLNRMNQIVSHRPTFVQLTNGEAILVAERERNFRNPELIRRTVSDWIYLSFNWDGVVPGTQEPDSGVAVQGSRQRVPFGMSIASYLLEPAFATEALKLMADEIVPSGVFNGEVRQVVTIDFLSEPRQIAPGRWQVDVQATRNLIDRRTGARQPILFNRTFTLRTVEIPQSPLGAQASLVEQLVYQTLSGGLQITDIRPFDPTALTPAP
ncbi:hypothetical protein H6G20_05395 [Desertifilum sp. FACHB-1129]|uniref:hypothetical protein n=1 Tax=unclassified Desertifilum TaxID=2621682 RepID=UPI001683FE06|nr:MULTISPECIES: hypothetical protein [unclassified Desertifilum]MBD2311118.1 hypothetical protein [Desertifilum sp. FACHB-1129]MBD2323985.1 hypothetical protein [Desertifilum sp. FACHB-866]MBD2333920.1 hypothetical protein [Desertifilum sp. FACHB-868]MDA0211231.1 hypothetical protein [Cyanobacteria bacterium FC1]